MDRKTIESENRKEVVNILDTFIQNSWPYKKREDEEDTGLFYFTFNDKKYWEFTLTIHYHYLDMKNTEVWIGTKKRHWHIYKNDIWEFEKTLTREWLAVIYYNLWREHYIDEHIYCKSAV